MADFRSVVQGDYFIKGIYRGVMDIGVGIVVYNFAPVVDSMLKRIRVIWISVLEILAIGICCYSIIYDNGKAVDILIIPCSCVFIFLCFAERGILYRIMECKFLKWIGGMSLYIYLTQIFGRTITRRLCRGIGQSLTISAILLVITVGVAGLFRYIIVPGEIWIAKKDLLVKILRWKAETF